MLTENHKDELRAKDKALADKNDELKRYIVR
jgi:hypothetical protein